LGLGGAQLISETKLREGLVDVYRLEILHQYLNKLDGWTLLVGADYSDTVIASQYDGNPHISFVRTHAYFGLTGIFLVLTSPLWIIFSRKSRRDRLVFSCFISLAILRAISEPILFPTLLDLFYFICFFIFWRYVPNRRAMAKLESSIGSVKK
jgi:hypothetical protein